MSLHRRNPKRDANELELVMVLRQRGFVVKFQSAKGQPDLLVSRRGSMWLVEIKSLTGKLTEDQVKWLEDWTGPMPIILRTLDDALAFPNRPAERPLAKGCR